MRSLFYSTVAFATLVVADNVTFNGSCDPTLSRLDPTTHKFVSDCNVKYYCDTLNNTCQYKACQNYDHTIAYDPGEPTPAYCPQGSFCPDAQNRCTLQLPLGASCELDRDGMYQLNASSVVRQDIHCRERKLMLYRDFQTSVLRLRALSISPRRSVFSSNASETLIAPRTSAVD
jgi:hypothetical protein